MTEQVSNHALPVSCAIMDIGRFELCLNVRDLEVAKEFYMKLGFVVTRGDPARGYLILECDHLSLGLYQGHIQENILNFRGGDVFAIADEMSRLGLAIEKAAEIENDGSAGAMIRDPDGNLIYFNTFPNEP